ncbi:MAG: ribosomal protein [Pseudomonadota bacterium]|jgi:small subunit ribosomal protein S4|nr:30S ribosomal protein S4 [Myxococcota bacterium]
MARYRGPRLKRCRAVGVVLPGLVSQRTLGKREYGPGVHGQRRKGKPSDYKTRLIEKQKLRWHYGVLETQFIRYIKEASRRRGPTGRELVSLLESRLDNIVWRLGLANTIAGARQLVVHGHITVDGKRVDRPSFSVSPNQEIAIREKARSKKFVQEALEGAASKQRPRYLELDPAKATGKMITSPELEDLPFECNLQAIIEFYSQRT